MKREKERKKFFRRTERNQQRKKNCYFVSLQCKQKKKKEISKRHILKECLELYKKYCIDDVIKIKMNIKLFGWQMQRVQN